jgi:hypothetical protein
MRRAQIEIVHHDPTLRAGISRNLFICIWTGTPEVAHVRVMRRSFQTLVTRYRERFGFLDVVVSGTPRFTDEVRNEVVRLIRDPNLQGRGSAHVILLPGLGGTTTRAFLSTVLLLGRSSTPAKVFGELSGGAAWLAPIVTDGGEVWSAEEVLSAEAELMRAAPAKVGG